MKLDKDQVIKIFKERKAILPCHRCGSQTFSVLDEYTKVPIQEDMDTIQNTLLGGPSVPALIVACNNCGAITLHALGALGLLPVEGAVKNADKK